MSRLHYTLDSEIELTQNAEINAMVQDQLPDSGNYDIAFAGVAKFLSGDYKQDSTDINDIVSNVTVNTDALNDAHFFLVTDGHDSRHTGYSVNSAAYFYTSASADKVQMGNNSNVAISGLLPYGNAWVAMTDVATGTQGSKINNSTLLKAQSSVADGLLQAVTAALFKKIGKNAAILNDAPMHGSLQTNFNTALGNRIDESQQDYTNSKFFKRYLESGRYQSDDHDTNQKSYVMNDTLVNMIVNISGSVTDSDGTPNLLTASVVNQIFGSGTKIDASGNYSIKAFVSLLHDERF
jgi:hypothetical protein